MSIKVINLTGSAPVGSSVIMAPNPETAIPLVIGEQVLDFPVTGSDLTSAFGQTPIASVEDLGLYDQALPDFRSNS